MKKIFLLFIFLFSGMQAQEKYFEGMVEGNYTDETSGVNYSVKMLYGKNGEILNELQGNYNDARGNSYNVQMKQLFKQDKIYLIYNSPKGKVYSEISAGTLNPLPGPFTLSDKKQRETFLNLSDIQVYKIDNGDKEIFYTISEGLKFPISKYKKLLEDYVFKGLAVNNLDYIPLKVEVKDKKEGKTLLTFEIKKINAKEVSETIFEIPKDAIKKDFAAELD